MSTGRFKNYSELIVTLIGGGSGAGVWGRGEAWLGVDMDKVGVLQILILLTSIAVAMGVMFLSDRIARRLFPNVYTPLNFDGDEQ